MERKITVATPKQLLVRAMDQEKKIIADLAEAMAAHKAYLEQLQAIEKKGGE